MAVLWILTHPQNCLFIYKKQHHSFTRYNAAFLILVISFFC